MRKVLLSAVLAAVCTMGATAMAATGTYTPGANNFTPNDVTGHNTIIIYKQGSAITGDSIFYVGQAEGESFEDGFTALMKTEGLTEGTYVVDMNGVTTPYKFKITKGQAAVAGDTAVEEAELGNEADGTYSAAYVATNVTNFSSINSIKFLLKDAAGAEYVAQVSKSYIWGEDSNWNANIEAAVDFGVQIDDIPTAGGGEMGLSADVVEG